MVLRQLEKPEAQEMYDTVTIDTVQIAWTLCEQFICQQHGVQNLADIPWGQGYGLLSQEFETFLRRITMLGYGLVLITHVDIRKEVNDNSEVNFYSPSLNKRCFPICNRIVDIIGYIDVTWDEAGNSHRWLYTRQTPTVMAGSRFKYLEPKIPLGYTELVNAIADAVEKSEKLDGVTVVDNASIVTAQEELDFNSIMSEAREVWTTILNRAATDEEKQNVAKAMAKKVELVFGHPVKLSEVTEDQCDLLNLALIDIKTML